jgi:putative tryptophan/tyrosine transport system substrate-binding protein
LALLLQLKYGEILILAFKRTHTFSIAALAVAFLLCNTAFLSAAELVVVKSSGIKPYNDALEGFKSTCMCAVTELNLPEIGKENIQEKIARIKPAGVLVIGMDALKSVSTMKDPPIFYTMVTEYGSGFPVNMKNTSGFSMDILPETYLRNMADFFPAAKRIGIIYSRQNTGKLVKDATAISRSVGLEIVAREVSGPGEVPAVIESLKGRIDIVWMLPDTLVLTPQTVDAMLLFSFQNKVPVFSFSGKYVKMGALASLSADPFRLGARTGELVVKKLNGGSYENPEHLHPSKVILTINKKIAEKFGLPQNSEIFRKADEVY